MPTINIPPAVRFALYIIGAIGLLTVSYAVDKKWAGDAEVRYVTGLCALLQLLAATKTNLRDEPKVIDKGVVDVATPEDGEGGYASLPVLLLIAVAVVVFVFALRG